ncbi:MAG: glutamate 5-kinase [Nannocystaceae bacterium]|nr:glutamate 5-kinase [Nannocystaceae bacterium]
MSPSRALLSSARRVVVKLGTGVVTHGGDGVALGRLHAIVEDLAGLRMRGVEVLLVSSGSVSMGARALGLRERPQSLGVRQACAAVGQGQLLSLYSQAFARLDVSVAQVLLTQDDLADRDRALCLRTTLLRLLEFGAIPVLNENDSVSVRELVEHRKEALEGFGDNDGLSALLAVAVDADALVLVTDVDGLHTANPATDPCAKRIDALEHIDEATRQRARGTSATGTGGMASKLDAAAVASAAGIPTLIVDGKTPAVTSRALAGDPVGTVLWPQGRKSARRRNIAAGVPHRGALIANAGALEALRSRKASLLPVGILEVQGQFARGDVVEIRDGSGRVHGRGLANYDAQACRAMTGRQSSELVGILGYRGYDAVITRDNLALSDV